MNDERKTKAQLVRELRALRAKSKRLERSEEKRKRLADELRESEGRFRHLVEQSPDAIVVHSGGTIVYVNHAAISLAGAHDRDEILGKSVLDFVHADSRDDVLRQLEVLGKDVVAPLLEEKLVKLDGTILDVEAVSMLTTYGDRKGVQVIIRDVSERKKSEQRLLAVQQQLHMLAAHLQNVREQERKHWSQEFHDQLGQSLTALKMDLTMLARTVADPGKELSRSTIATDIASMQDMIDRAIGTIREILSELRPEMLDQLGIVPTLEWESERFELHSGVSCTFTSEDEDIKLSPNRSIVLYRIFQEAVTNVARHSKATHAEVALRKDCDDLILEITDNGIGLSADAEIATQSFGLVSMRERAILLGGTLEIHGVAGKGTSILVRIPYQQTAADGGAGL